jgi:hypothetical protein
MKTEELVVDLARQAAPVAVLRPPVVRLLTWLPLALLSGLAGVAVYGLREDSATMAYTDRFAIDAALAAIVLLSGAAAALVLAVPGAERRPFLRFSAVTALVGWTAYGVAALATAGGTVSDLHWPVCVLRIATMAILPGVALVAMVRRGAPLSPRWTSSLALAAAAAVGALAIQVICPVVTPDHLLIGHIGPVVLAAIVAAVAASRLSRARI